MSRFTEARPVSAERRERFLGDASRVLAESLDRERTLRSVARLTVPAIADWCNIDLLREDGGIVRVASEHWDPRQAELTAAMRENPPRPDAVCGAPHVIRTGTTEYVPSISDPLLAEREPDPARLSILRRLAVHSTVCAPLISRGRTLGAITLSTALGRELTLDDVRMVEDLAHRAAIAIDNARLYTDAQRALQAREEILAIVTHDLRAPLSAVLTAASLLTSADAEHPDGERVRQRGETIGRAARHMFRLVRDLTDLAQIDIGRLTMERTLQAPAEVVQEVREALEPVVVRRGGSLRTEIPQDLPPIVIDRDRIRQVLANLIGNANNAGASTVSVGVGVRGRDLVFHVSDNGPGIPAEDLEHMFDRYWRGRGTQYQGSGLGLPIAHGIIEAHGGSMWVESTPGEGSRFAFSIPI